MKKINSSLIKAVALAIILLGAQQKYALGQNAKPDKKSSVLVDRYGQLIKANFEKKVTNEKALESDVAEDRAYYDSLTPPKRDIYGGLLNSKDQFHLSAMGFFHIEKLSGGRFSMVDPMGNIYFSLGVDGVGYTGDTYTRVKGRENIYQWLPDLTTEKESPDYQFLTAFLKRNPDNFSFFIANRIRKTKRSFDAAQFYNESVARLKKWGFTSEGGFSVRPDENQIEMRFPQVRFANLPEKDMIPGAGLFDIYKPSAQEDIRKAFEQERIAAQAENPLIIGYFFGNEFQYQNFKNIIPAKKASEVASKRALVDFLKNKYSDKIDLFNKSWGTSFSRFDELYETGLNVSTDNALKDMYGFFELFLDKFYSTISKEFRKLDRNHMLIGDRYFTAPMNNEQLRNLICKVAGKYLDVISYNYYTYDVDLTRIKSMSEIACKPVMLTEFHYGEPTEGQTSAVQMVDNEQEKGYAYRNYVEKLAASGYVVGTHWFEYLDEAITGRWFQGYNGESYAVGLINVADRPYKKFLSSVMKCNYDIYDLLLGKKQPYSYNFGPGRSERHLKNTINILQTKVPIIEDGLKDSSWPGGEQISLDDKDRVIGLQQGNASADISLTWDKTNLYVFAHISDESPMANGFTGGDLWNGDAIEIFIGPDNIEQGGPLQAKDTQIVLGACSDNLPHYFWANRETEKPPIDMAIKMDGNHKGYTIEAAIPLNKLYLTPLNEHRKFRFDIGFDAGDNHQRNAQYLWNGSATNSQVREDWGLANLAE